jgi:outer membrane protein TolC
VLPDIKSASAGVDVSWEIDLSGRLRAGARAAAADAVAAEDGERAVRLLVMTDVASNYFTLVGAQRQLETVRAIAAAEDETLDSSERASARASRRRSTSSARRPTRRARTPRFRRSRRWPRCRGIASRC